MRIALAGENALIIYFDDAGFSAQPSPEVAARVQAAKDAVSAVLDTVLIDLIPSYASLTLIFDALKTGSFLYSSNANNILTQQDNMQLRARPVSHSAGLLQYRVRAGVRAYCCQCRAVG